MAVNDFTYEALSDKGILSGEVNYYMVLHYRLKELGRIKDDNQETIDFSDISAIPPLNAVISCYYYPYLNGEVNARNNVERNVWKSANTIEEVYTWQYPLVFINTNVPIEHSYGWLFDWVSGKTESSTVEYGGKVLRPEKILFFPESEKDKVLFTFNAYTTKPSTVGSNTFTWKNESKCYQYPYRYLEFNDGFTEPFYIVPQLLQTNENNEFHARHGLNINGQFELYIKGYKGDANGFYQAKQVNGIPVPINKDQYTNYVNENKSQRNLFYMNQIANFLIGGATGNISGEINSAFNIANQIAMEKDIKRLPDNITLGSEFDYGLQKSAYLYEIEHMVNEQDMERIGLFFHYYGYAQNKYIKPTFKGRKYWNYLKTKDVNVKVDCCPKEHLDQLKQIFDSGVTVWHYEGGNMFENTEKDNTEI